MDKNKHVINQIVSTIVTSVAPDRIILFGSYTRGYNGNNSDIDLLILKKGLKNERVLLNHLYLKELLKTQ